MAPVLQVTSQGCVLTYKIWEIYCIDYLFKNCLFVENNGSLHFNYSCYSPPPATKVGGTQSPGVEGDGGLIFWKTQDIGLASYSNNLYTGPAYLWERGRVWTQNIQLQILLA